MAKRYQNLQKRPKTVGKSGQKWVKVAKNGQKQQNSDKSGS